MVKKESAYIVLVGKPEGKGPVRSSDVDGTIILKWVLEN
jgi:hypothetical protein